MCDAMNVIDKLNEEFDEVQNKNIELEKENLQLYKEIHKLKFKLCIEDEIPDTDVVDNCGGSAYGDERYWSSDLEDAVEKGLEKNVILREIYDIPEPCEIWNEIEIVDCNIAANGAAKELIDSFPGGVFH